MLAYEFGKQELWEGCVLGGVVNAVMSAESDLFSRFRRWNNDAYVLDGLDGRQGVVVFEDGLRSANGRIVGLFFDANSDLSPFRSTDYELNTFVRDMPAMQREMATRAIDRFLLDIEDDTTISLVTSAFWSRDPDVVGSRSWDEVLRNGASLIEAEIQGGNEAAVARWTTSYKMSPTQAAIVLELFHLRIAYPGDDITLETGFVHRLNQITSDSRSADACRDLLAYMRLFYPT